MKRLALNLAAAAIGLIMIGCETHEGTPNRGGTGALIGAGAGAATGALIGSGGGHAGEGALIGGAIGAAAGGLIGHSMDQEERARLRAQSPQTYERIDQGQPLAVQDVEAMAGAGLSDDVIISQIRATRTVYHLSSADIINLHNAGVSPAVIDFMINTPGMVASAPVPPPQQTVYVTQAPPPARGETYVVAPGPGYVWIGGEWIWRGGWVWVGGHWAYPPRPHAVWVGGYWGRGPHGWRHSPGHWR